MVDSPRHRRYAADYSPPEVRHALRYITVAWVFGAAHFAITGGATFASFLKTYLHVDDLVYGLVMAAGPAASVFWFLGSYVVERTGRSKPIFLIFVTSHRLVWMSLALTPLLLAHGLRSVAVALVVTVAFVSAAAASFGGVGWYTWMATIVPRTLAGRYFGHRARLGLLSMLTAGILAAVVVDHFHGAGAVYALVFTVAAVLGAIDILLFLRVREAPRPGTEERPTLAEILVTPWRDQRFRVFAAYVAVTWVAYAMLGSFVFPFCFERVEHHGLGFSLFQATALVVILPQLMSAWAAPAWGRAIDRFGPKPVLRAGSMATVFFPALWLVTHSRSGAGEWNLTWLVPVCMALCGLAQPALDQTLVYLQLRHFPEHRRTAYTATYMVVAGLAAVVGAMLGGVSATFWHAHLQLVPLRPSWLSHYHPVFLTSIALRYLSFRILFPNLRMEGRAGCRVVFRAVAKDVLSGLRLLGGRLVGGRLFGGRLVGGRVGAVVE